MPPLLFDAVVFDLDGTLVATDRFWLAAAGRGARRAFAQLGLDRALPSDAQWMSLVGTPIESGFRALFPELSAAQRDAVLRACVAEEEAALAADGVPAMPGAREVVRALHARGAALAIASNCQGPYLDHMLDGLGLRRLVVAAFCRDTPGVVSKADMVRQILERLGTRSAVMVGDRSSDRDAAWMNGIPHVHCAFGFAQGDEEVDAEGRIAALAELPRLLEGRARWLGAALARIGVPSAAVRTVGITGPPASGKTLLARDAARLLVAQGVPAAALALGGTGAGGVGAESWERALGPRRRAGGELDLEHGDLLGARTVPPEAVLFLEGPGLVRFRARLGLDRVLELELAPAVAARRRRGAARPGPALFLPDQDAPGEPGGADLVLEASNPLGAPLEAPAGRRSD